MKIFLDTADVAIIKELATTGLIDGVTTNPTIIAKSGRKFEEVIKEICAIVEGPVSAEVVSTEASDMLKEASKLAEIAKNVCIKLPLTIEGLKACSVLSKQGIMTNVTLCFSANQALMAAKAGATFVSPFIGRLDDISQDGMQLIADIRMIFDNYNFGTQILAASIRHTVHFLNSAKIGADVATIPPQLLKQLITHPLTDSGLEKFMSDWKSVA